MTDNLSETLAIKLRVLRVERRSTQNQRATELGVSFRTYHAWENGKLPPTEQLIRIAANSGVSMDWLLGLSDDRKVHDPIDLEDEPAVAVA